MKRLGSLAAQMILTPGAHMIWQFEELGNSESTKNDTGNDTRPKKVNWNLLNDADRKGLHDTYASLCAIRSDYANLFREGVATTVDLKEWGARYIALANDRTELYLVVNPSVSETATIPMPKNPLTGATVDLSSCTLLTSGYDGAPTLSAGGISLPAGSFAVYGGEPDSGISSISADREGIFDPDAPVEIFSLSGVRIGSFGSVHEVPLLPGIYLIRQGSLTVKHIVR